MFKSYLRKKKQQQKHTEFASFAKEIRLGEGAEINGYSFHALGVASPQAGYILEGHVLENS